MLSSADTILGLDTGDFSDTQMEMFALIVATAFRREGGAWEIQMEIPGTEVF